MLKLNKESYSKLIQEDVYLVNNYMPDGDVRDHIKLVLYDSIDMHYPGVKKCMQEQDNWINVEDALPQPNVRVRAIRTYGNGRMEEIHSMYVERTECFDDLLDIITHWQYIPLPTIH